MKPTFTSQEGFEPPTVRLEGECSIQLSYWDMLYSQVEYLSILRHGAGFVKVCQTWAGPFSWLVHTLYFKNGQPTAEARPTPTLC